MRAGNFYLQTCERAIVGQMRETLVQVIHSFIHTNWRSALAAVSSVMQCLGSDQQQQQQQKQREHTTTMFIQEEKKICNRSKVH